MTQRNTEFVNALDGLIKDFCALGVSLPYIGTMLRMKADDLREQFVNASPPKSDATPDRQERSDG